MAIMLSSLSRKNPPRSQGALARVVALHLHDAVDRGEAGIVVLLEPDAAATQLGDLGLDVGDVERQLRERALGGTAGSEQPEHAGRTLVPQAAGAFLGRLKA